jgi:hypothetical protein
MVYRGLVYNRAVRLLPFNLRSYLFTAACSQPRAIRQRFDSIPVISLMLPSIVPCHPDQESAK